MNQEQINEKLSASAPAKDWIEDFVKSDDPKFDGKTKDERIMMALGAYYAAQKNESVELEEVEALSEGAPPLGPETKKLDADQDAAFKTYSIALGKAIEIGKQEKEGHDSPRYKAAYNQANALRLKSVELGKKYRAAREVEVAKWEKEHPKKKSNKVSKADREGDLQSVERQIEQLKDQLRKARDNDEEEKQQSLERQLDSLKDKHKKLRGVHFESVELEEAISQSGAQGMLRHELQNNDYKQMSSSDIQKVPYLKSIKKKIKNVLGSVKPDGSFASVYVVNYDDGSWQHIRGNRVEYGVMKEGVVSDLEENAGYMETLHTKYKFLRRQADEAEEKYQKAKERNLDDDSLETYYTAVRTLNDRADDVYDAYVDAKDKAKKNESVELEEAVDFRDMKNASLKQWLKRNDTADSVSGVFGAQILAAKKEAKRRGIDFNEGSVSLNFDREGEIPVTEGKTTDCAIDDLEDAIEDQEEKKKKEKAEGEGTCKTEALDPVGKEDDDVDNDGDSDESDEYLKNRRKTVTKAIQNESKADEIKVGTHVTLRNGKVGRVTNVSSDKEIIDVKLNDGGKEVSVPIGKLSLFEEVEELEEGVEAHGVKGSNSTKWRKTFKDRAALNAWVDANDAEVYAVSNDSNLDEGVEEIKARVAKYKVGDKTNFGVIKSISSTSIEFKSKDLPVTKIAFNQRKMGSKDFVLDRLSRMNESFTEARDLKIAQLALRSDGSGKLEDFVKNYSVVGKSILQIKEEYAMFLKANKKQEEEGIQNYP
jgi:hypothetical protein